MCSQAEGIRLSFRDPACCIDQGYCEERYEARSCCVIFMITVDDNWYDVLMCIWPKQWSMNQQYEEFVRLVLFEHLLQQQVFPQ